MFERFYWDNDGTLTDQTIEWSNPYSNAAVFDGKSYLYISSYLPFNHRYFDISVANDQGGTLSIEHWYNDEWNTTVDNLDYTEKLTKSGNILFTIDEDNGWDAEDDSSDITELSTTKVYNAYWMRLTLAASVASSLSINYIGYKFAEDSDLLLKYPMLRNTALKTAFATGKEDWHDQLILASDFIISDLKSRNLMISKNQLLTLDRFTNACVYKTAEIIFTGLGEKWIDLATRANNLYNEDMNLDNFGIDQNQDGVMDRVEKTVLNQRMTR
jgi:hypothetical protein